MDQRWRYQRPDGKPVWLAFDPQFPCLYCNRAVTNLSMGGPAVCPSCDCGMTDGKKWDMAKAVEMWANARKRLSELEPDGMSELYECSHRANPSLVSPLSVI